MPIDRSKYPDNWDDMSQKVIERAGNECEWCGVKNHAVGFRDNTGAFHPVPDADPGDQDHYFRIILTTAHLDHDPWNNNVCESRLAALCQRCHLNFDRGMNKHKEKFGKEFNHQNQLRLL